MVRLAALMQLPATYVWTHDSIGLGEDGPTHHPVEQLAALLADNPGTSRPPAGLILSRQKLPVLDRGPQAYRPADGTARGGCILSESTGGPFPDVVLVATGSEVQLALDAQQLLAERQHRSPGGLDAVPRMVYRPTAVLPRRSPATTSAGPGERGGGDRLRLA